MKTTTCPEEDPREARALARYAAVQTVMQARQAGQSLASALQQASQQLWEGRLYSPATIEEWFYRYRHGRFGALQCRPRRDKGTQKALDPAAIEELLKLRRDKPALTVTALAAELERRGVLEKGAWSAATLHRRLREAGLDRQSLRAGSGSSGPTKAFELPLPNLLWMADCMHGPTIQTENGAQRTYLFALIDDCTRMMVYGQFYPHERQECFLDALRRAVESRCLPDKLYTDNGKTFRNQHLGIVCANLGIRLIHAKPYHAWSKGKIERFFRTCQSMFVPTLGFQPVHAIEELNRRFWFWVDADYNQREHSALDGESPAERFARLGQGLRMLPEHADLDELFFMRVKRRVRKDATFSLDGRFWEVPVHLRGRRVEIRFDPVGWSRVEVYDSGRYVGAAKPCDKTLNAQLIASSNTYEHDAF